MQLDGKRVVGRPFSPRDRLRRFAHVAAHVRDAPVARPLDVGHGQVKVVERLSQLRTRRAASRQQQQKRQGSGQEAPGFHGRALTHSVSGPLTGTVLSRPEGLQLLCKGSGPPVAGSLQASGASASTGLWHSEGQHVLRRPVATAAHVAPEEICLLSDDRNAGSVPTRLQRRQGRPPVGSRVHASTSVNVTLPCGSLHSPPA